MTEIIIRFRYLIIAAGFTICILAGLFIPLSETDPEIRNYIPAAMESRIKTDSIEAAFGVQDMVVILFIDSTIITHDNLLRIKKIDRSISGLPGVSRRISPFNSVKIAGNDGFISVAALIEEIPENQEDLELLREAILSDRFARGVVFSDDLTTASITCVINSYIPESKTIADIDSILASNPGRADIAKGGLPYVRSSIMEDVKTDAYILVPLALIIMLLTLKAGLGRWRDVFIPFIVVLLSTALCMGLIPLLGWKISIITVLVPIILIAVANNYGIYMVAMFRKLQNGGSAGLTRTEMIKEVSDSLSRPVMFSGLTTIAGISGLLAHSVIPARQVGVLAAAGVGVALVLSIIMIPAMLYMSRISSNGGQNNDMKSDRLELFLTWISDSILKRPGRSIKWYLLISLLIATGGVFLKTETNQEMFFPSDHPVREASEIINNRFGGTQTVSVMIEGDIFDPVIMKGIDSLTTLSESIEGVGNVFSVSQALREISKILYDEGEEGYDKIPGSREAIAQMFELYFMSGDPDDFSQLLNLENTRAHVLIRVSDPSSEVISNIRKELSQFREHLPVETIIGGYAIIMSDFASMLIKGQVFSILIALLTVLVLLALIFRSLRAGIAGIVLLLLSILVLFGFMGVSGIRLDAATALLSSIMIGVGVDFTIQYVWSFSRETGKGTSWEEAVRITGITTGRSMIINASAVMAGFAVLLLSGFTSIRFFGGLVIISIGSCLAGALVLIPAFLIKTRPRFITGLSEYITKHKNY